MRFLLDQSTDARLAPFLVSLGHEATRIGREHLGGLPDREVLAIARREGRILITDDRDFGELIIKERLPHAGVIFLRLGDEADLATKQERVAYALTNYTEQLTQFLVVTKTRVRVRSTSAD